MPQLFQRDFSLTVDTLKITELDVSFKVTRALGREPNTAEISVKNLTEAHRAQLTEKASVRVVLEAGYKVDGGGALTGPGATFSSGTSLIFAGDLREVKTMREGADLVTRISSGDGEKGRRQARINRSFGPGSSLLTVIEACAEAMGVGLGNLRELRNPEFQGAGGVFPSGTAVSGSVADILGDILRSAGFTYSIQDGQLQILKRGTALAATAVVLSSETGLIDTPNLSSDGTMRARMLMTPDVFPGRKIEMRAENVRGFFRVKRAEYTGDTTGADWFIDVECDQPS